MEHCIPNGNDLPCRATIASLRVTAGLNCRHLIVSLALALEVLPVGRAPAQEAPWFTDAATPAGLTFTHFNGMSGEFYYPEIMPPGVALFDFDNDGDLDVFVVQGRMLGSKPIDRAQFPPGDASSLRGRLFRNDLQVTANG